MRTSEIYKLHSDLQRDGVTKTTKGISPADGEIIDQAREQQKRKMKSLKIMFNTSMQLDNQDLNFEDRKYQNKYNIL